MLRVAQAVSSNTGEKVDEVIWQMPIAQSMAILAIVQRQHSTDKNGKPKHIPDHREREVNAKLLSILQENIKK